MVFMCSAAHAQTQVQSDDFSGTTASQAWQVYGGACLTAGSGLGTIPACATNTQGGLNGNTPDTAGNGALRLTQAIGGTPSGGVISLNSFPSSAGFSATFSAVSYGGNGADGISFFLLDASQGIPAALGAPGGGLNYAGISYGYLGVGVDEFGNFVNPGCGGGGCAGGPGFLSNAIGVRGSTANANAYIASRQPGFSLWSNVAKRSLATSHSYTISMTSAGILSVSIDGTAYLTNVNAFAQTGAIPAFLRVGFAGSIGGSNNIHEIMSFKVSSLSLSNLVISKTKTVISDPVNGTIRPVAIPGAVVRYCVQVSNLAGSPTATSIVVTDPIGSLPVTFVANSINLNGTSTSGNCNWNGTAGGTFASNTVTGNLANLAGGATETLYFDVTIK